MSQGPTLKMKKRLNYIVITAIILAFCVLVGSLVNIGILNHSFYLDYAESRQLRPETIAANRGSIYDRNMSVLAKSATVWDVTISPRDISANLKDKPDELQKKKEAIAKILSEILEIDYEKVLAQTKKNNQYEIIKKKIEKDTEVKIRQAIKENGWANEISLVENTKRYYPNSTLAASVIGFTGSDSDGRYGLEYQYNSQLSGTPGYIVSLKNGHSENIPMSFEEKHDPIDGNSLVLTIDETIQRYLEKALSMVMAQHSPKMGCAGIVMNVNTGDVLAMANLPSFDLNQPLYIYDNVIREEVAKITDETKMLDAKYAAQQNQWKNKAISYDYEPGSTFKTITASAALEEKTSSLNSTFNCHGVIQVQDKPMRCWVGLPGHGHLDFTGALVNSCNPSFVKIASDLGAQSFFKYFQGFGLTEKTGIDLPGEGKGAYISEKLLTNSKVSLASVSFGQSTTVTSLQMITAVSAVVNGGNLVTPHVVKDILDQNGNIVKSIQTDVKRQVVSEETSKTLRTLMEAVVETKKGANAYIQGYRIGGKSGTSQKQKKGDSTEDRIASYIGVAPINNPEIAVYIMVDVPQSGDIYGSVIAAPAVKSVLADTLPYLGYSPSFSEEQIAKHDITVPHLLTEGVLEAESKLLAEGFLKPKIIGNGHTIVKQVPSTGSKMPKDGTVILYTDNSEEKIVTVPNVISMSPIGAKQKLKELGLNVVISGYSLEHSKSKVMTQSLQANTKVPVGTVIQLTSVSAETD
ncbi:MAG: penicillin-binding transpeptidase domain-containing protein [Oscillospiraceae bacterium]